MPPDIGFTGPTMDMGKPKTPSDAPPPELSQRADSGRAMSPTPPPLDVPELEPTMMSTQVCERMAGYRLLGQGMEA